MDTVIPKTIELFDIDGHGWELELHGAGYYRLTSEKRGIGIGGKILSGLVSDGTTIKLDCNGWGNTWPITFWLAEEPWSPMYLGYENLWMLISYYPLEHTPGLSGYPVRGEAGRAYSECTPNR